MKRIKTLIIGLFAIAISLGLWVLTAGFQVDSELLQIWVNFLRLLFAVGIGFGLGVKALKRFVGEASSND